MSAAPPDSLASSSTLRSTWVMLLALIGGFALSQAYRTVAGILSVPLIHQFGLTPHEMGSVAAAFHFAFGGMQLFMGIGIDVYGIRRTILMAFPLTVLGAALSALAPSPSVLMIGQILIGVGCAPAFLVCTVFIARHFPAHRFAAMSGLALGMGGMGMIFTGTPLAWVVEQFGWRSSFWLLSGLSLLAWLGIFWRVHDPLQNATHPQNAATTNDAPKTQQQPHQAKPKESPLQALKSYGVLLRMPHTAGILALVFVGYASFITLRGLWLAPYLGDRFGHSLIYSGNVALVLSIISLFSPSFFGRLDPGDGHRRTYLKLFPWTLVILFLILAFSHQPYVAIAAIIGVSIFMGCSVWQYADVRSAYPSHMTGRAMALFTMSMFLGVAVMQSVTGIVADWALSHQVDKYRAVFACVAVILALGAIAYSLLPKPRLHSPQ